MTTVQSQVTDQQNLEPFFYLRISGLPYYFFSTIDPSSSRYGSFAWSTPTSYPSGWNRGGLMLPDDTIDQKFQDIIGGIASPGRIRLSVMDFPDPSANGYGFFSRLFAPGRFLSDTSVTRAQIIENVHADSTDIEVRDGAATFTDNTDVYIGAETIGIGNATVPDGDGNSTLPIDDRNKYVCYGNTQDDPDTAWPPIPYHRIALDPSGADSQGAVVSTIPGAVLGRTAALWVGHMRPDGNPEPESSSACMLLGRITNLDIGKVGGVFDITIESVTADLEGAQVAPDLGLATIKPGIYIDNTLAWTSLGLFYYMTAVDGSSASNFEAIITVDPGVYTVDEIRDAVNVAIQEVDTGDSDKNAVLHATELVVHTPPDSGQPNFRFLFHEAQLSGAIIVEPNLINNGGILLPKGTGLATALGFDNTQNTIPAAINIKSAVATDDDDGDASWIIDAVKSLPSVFVPTYWLDPPAQIAEFVLNQEGAAANFFTDQNDGSAKAYVRFSDGQIAPLVTTDDGANTLSIGPATTGFADNPTGFFYAPVGSEATVEQVVIIADKVTGASSGSHAAFLGQLLASTTGQTETQINVMPEGVGMGWSAILDIDDWVIEFESSVPRRLYVDRSTRFKDIFTPIAREHGLFIVWDPSAGKARLRSIKIPQPANAETFVFSDSNRAKESDRTSQRLDSTSLRTSWKLQFNWDWSTQKWLSGPVTINDVVARSNYPNNARQETIEDKTLVLPAQIGTAIRQRFGLYGSAWTMCQRSVNKTGLLMAPGTIHKIIDTTMVNPYTGATGITSSDKVYGFLVGIATNPATGEVTATFAVNSADDNAQYRQWSPAGLIDFDKNDDDFVNGYNPDQKILRMANRYTAQTGSVFDGVDFRVGDKIIVSRRDLDDIATYAQSDEIAAIDATGVNVTLVSGLGAGVSADVESILILDFYGNQVTARKTGDDRVAWQGDGVTRTIGSPSSVRLNKWG